MRLENLCWQLWELAVRYTAGSSCLGRVAAERAVLVERRRSGIDGVAHGGCLESGGETAVILAHGHNRIYQGSIRTFSKIC